MGKREEIHEKGRKGRQHNDDFQGRRHDHEDHHDHRNDFHHPHHHENGSFLEVNDLVVEYTSAGSVIHAVNGVSFSLERGKSLGLVGETGAGKTTIAKAILRILPDPPAKIKGGEVWLDGKNILEAEEKKMLEIRGAKIAMIFQDPMTALNPVMSVGSQITESVQLHSDMNKENAMKRAIEMLETVGIPAERYVEYPHQFSGGMKQRVVIAMALACNPQLLLADEPTTALDVTIQAQVLEMINDLKKKFNTALIMITHDLGVVAETCDNVGVVYAGQIVEYGTKEDIFRHVSHPYTVGLFNSVPNIYDNKSRLTPIPGLPPDPTALPRGCNFSPRCPYATESCRKDPIPLYEVAPGHMCRCLKYAKEGADNE